MFGSRRKSFPKNPLHNSLMKPDDELDKRRRSDGFMNNTEVMSVGGNSLGGFTTEWVQRGRWHIFPPLQPDGIRSALADLRHPGLDAIRFASYRTAAKLRYVQKRTNMHLIDIWNIIEAFRENGLNTLDPHESVKVSRLEALLSTVYHCLNKRLPAEQHIDIEASTSTILNWLLAAYDGSYLGQLRVFSVKVALATLCNSKPLDKLRYVFSQISDGNGHLVMDKFSEYLHEMLSLPAAVFESPSFHFSPELVGLIFEGISKVNVNDFMDIMLGDPSPECLSWLPLLHRLAVSETVVHQTICDGCRRDTITGLRYKCDQCYNYNLCQDCFWLGRISAPHSLNHPVKEYLTFNSSQQLSSSVRRSLRCVPDRLPADRPRFPETPERTLDLSHIVPPSQANINGFEEDPNGVIGSCDTWSSGRSLSLSGVPDWTQLDDEHRLIAHYAACLAGQTTSPGCESTDSSHSFDPHKTKKELVIALERKNKEITKQINRIKEHQEKCEGGRINPDLVSELKALRSHRTQLESHLISLQDSRKNLLGQLEGLMRLLKALKSPGYSAIATRGCNSLGGSATTLTANGHRSAPPTPSHGIHYSSLDSLTAEQMQSSGFNSLRSGYNTGSLGHHQRARSEERERGIGVGGELSPDSEGEKLRNDLLLAADSVTNAMSSLVRELNSESSEDESQVKLRKSSQGSDSKLSKGSKQELNGSRPEVNSIDRKAQRLPAALRDSSSRARDRDPSSGARDRDPSSGARDRDPSSGARDRDRDPSSGDRDSSSGARDSWSEPPAGLLKQ